MLTSGALTQIMGRLEMNKRVKIPGNKYIWIAVIVLVVFIVGLVWKGIVAAAFWSILAAALMVYLAFDPRIKRHW